MFLDPRSYQYLCMFSKLKLIGVKMFVSFIVCLVFKPYINIFVHIFIGCSFNQFFRIALVLGAI